MLLSIIFVGLTFNMKIKESSFILNVSTD